MGAGLTVTKAALDSTIGDATKTLNTTFDEIRQLKEWLDTQQDTDLEGLGYNAGDVATVRSAFSDLDQLRTIYEGTAALAAAKDFRTFSKLLYGLGF